MKICETKAELSKALKAEAQKQGFDPIGIASIPGGKRLNLRTKALERWLEAGNQAECNG